MEAVLLFNNTQPVSTAISVVGLVLVAAVVAVLAYVSLTWRPNGKVLGSRVLIGVAAGDIEASLWSARLAFMGMTPLTRSFIDSAVPSSHYGVEFWVAAGQEAAA